MLSADPGKESPYEILQVGPAASQRDVDEAFKRASSKTQRLTNAYRALHDIQERLKLDIFQLVIPPDSTPGAGLKRAFQGFDPASLLDAPVVGFEYVRPPEEGGSLWPRADVPEVPIGDAKEFSLAPPELPDVSFDR